MSGVIKCGSAAAALAALPIATHQPVQREEVERLRRRIARLEADLRERDAELSEAEAKAEADVREAYQLGHAAGLDQAEKGVADRLALLGTGIEDAQAGLRDYFANAEQLALLVAEEALARMFARAEDMAPLVEQAIRRQIAELGGSAILAISISGLDFDEVAATRLAAHLGKTSPQIRLVDDLPRGGCSIRLRLGEIDAGLPQQWTALRAFLARLAEESGA